MKTTGMIMCALIVTGQVCAQTHTEKISKTFKFEKVSEDNALIVANINGSIQVEGYNGADVIVEVEKTINGKTTERFEKGKQQIQLGVIDLADSLILFVEGTGATFGRRFNRHSKTYEANYGYDWCCNNCNNGCECRLDFTYKLNFVVKVPRNVHIVVSTVNEGNISVSESGGIVHANNVNGSIKLTDLVREASASTINGDVDIEYASNPKKDCRFYTLNGDINAWVQKGLAARMSFESFNGGFYTNITNLESLPVTVEKKADSKGMKYKVNGNQFQVGKGATAMIDFETFNGDVFLKERTN